jgi:phosphate starvation-inducible membrane PsiE
MIELYYLIFQKIKKLEKNDKNAIWEQKAVLFYFEFNRLIIIQRSKLFHVPTHAHRVYPYYSVLLRLAST